MPSHPIDVRPLVLALALLSSVGCSAIVGEPCEQGYASCGGTCIAIASDPDHCGGCDIVCASRVCVAGACVGGGDAQVHDGSVVIDAGVAEAGIPIDSGSALDGGSTGDPDTGVTTTDAATVDDAGTDGDTTADDAWAAGADAFVPDDAALDAATSDASGSDGGTVVCDIGEISCAGTCVMPTTDGQNCGTCGTVCLNDFSCSNGVCVMACAANETRCDRGCVDTTSDANHCGGCDIVCATGICAESACVSGYAGHLVVIAHDYTEARSAEDLLLWHALTIGAARTPRVLRYVGDSAPAAAVAVDEALVRIGSSYAVVADPEEVPLRLASADVFLVDAQHDADATTLGAIGTAWSRALDSFLGRGGVVVALDALQGPGAALWLSAAGLVDSSDHVDSTDEVVRVTSPSDGLVAGVPLSFRASASSVQWSTPSLPVVVAGDTGGIVMHLTVLPM